MHFPGLSHSGSASRVLHKGADSVGPVSCALTGLSSSGPQVLGEFTLPGEVRLIASFIPAARFPGCTAGASSQVCHVSLLGSRFLFAILLEDVNCPGSQEDLVSNWGPAHSLVEDAISGAEIAPFQLWLSPACLWWGMGQTTSDIRSVLCSVSRPAVP